MSQAGLKAGLIGGAIVAVLQLVGLVPIPCLGCAICLLVWAVYVGAGALAGYWLPAPRSVGDGVGAGAIAGVITGVVGGIFGMIASAVQFAFLGGAEVLAQLPPEVTDLLRDMEVDPGMFSGEVASIGTVLGAGAICCVAGIVLAAVLGAVGGAVFAALQSE